MQMLIVFITVALIACQIQADVVENYLLEEESLNSNRLFNNNLLEEESLSLNESFDLENCEERMCSRIYSPICISINEKKFDVASPCYLANLRCELSKYIMKNANDQMPQLRVLHFGQCED